MSVDPFDNSIKTLRKGEIGQFNFSLSFFRHKYSNQDDKNHENEPISPWHNIPSFIPSNSVNENTLNDLIKYNNEVFLNKSLKDHIEYLLSNNNHENTHYTELDKLIVNMVVEIPKGRLEKLEIRREEFGNPIAQDYKGVNQLRFLNQAMPWNYGAIPQTWEDPNHYTGFDYKGDNDPLDIIEIGSTSLPMGAVTRVRLIGCFGLLDENELDWKLIGIRVSESIDNDKLNSDISKIRNWFQNYKISENKPPNTFLFNGDLLSAKIAGIVLLYCHSRWKLLINSASDSSVNKSHKIWIPLNNSLLPVNTIV